MAWIVLIVSGLFEAVWAIALGKTEGFSRLVPSVVFGAGLVISMAGLAYAMKDISTGTAYAVWVGIGASMTIIYGMAVDGESISWAKVLLLTALVGCIVGLKFVE
ncbi:MAG TPA: SMR family transporter [Arthrobacter sp.]|nr:SMR family transporter [Arthrobacter sp.]